MGVLSSRNHEGSSPWGYTRISGTSPTQVQSPVAHGANALAFAATGGYVEETVPGFNTVSFYYRWPVLPSTNSNFAHILNVNNGFMTFLQTANTGVLRLKNPGSVNKWISAAGLLQANTWHRFELYAPGTGFAQVKVFLGDSTTPLADSGLTDMTDAAASVTPALYRIGNISATFVDAHLDSVQAADSSPGPWPAQVAPTGPTFQLLNANGTTSPLTLEGMWNGTAVVPLTVT